MLENINATVEVFETTKKVVLKSYDQSIIGHEDLANILGVPCNRVNTKLKEGDILFVAQYVGGRLPEGSSTLPEGAEIKFIKIKVKYRTLETISMDEARAEYGLE